MRSAVIYLVERESLRWDALSIAQLCHVSLHQARCYTRHLLTDQVLVELHECLFRGESFAEWVAHEPRTRPGGWRREYLREREEREERYAQEQAWRVEMGRRIRELRIERGLGIHQLCKRAHVGFSVVQAIEKGKRTARRETLLKIQSALGEAS
jgi:DNA-binding XRE family transcriptional regulator